MFGTVLIALRGLWANPLARKITIYALIGLAALYAFRQYSNKIYFNAKAELRQELAKEQAKAHEKEIAVFRKELTAQADANKKELEAVKVTFAATLQEQERRFVQREKVLNTNLGALDEKYKIALQNIAIVSDDKLDAFLRELSNRIASSNANPDRKAANSGATN